jgi:predicted transcriptional regulator
MKSLRQYQPKDLGPQAQRVIQFKFDHPEMTQRQIAKELGISEARVSFIVRQKRFRDALPYLAKESRKDLIPLAAKVEKDLLKSDNDEVRRKVVAGLWTDHKVSEPEPRIEINIFQSMKNDELTRIVDQSKSTIQDIVDVDLVDEHGK